MIQAVRSISTTLFDQQGCARILPLSGRHDARAPCHLKRWSGARGLSGRSARRGCSVRAAEAARVERFRRLLRAVGAEGRPDLAGEIQRCIAIRIGRGEDRSLGPWRS
jgi:hypothetical protein